MVELVALAGGRRQALVVMLSVPMPVVTFATRLFPVLLGRCMGGLD